VDPGLRRDDGREKKQGKTISMTNNAVPPLEFDALVKEARRRAGLEDFGSEAFVEPLQVLLDSIRREARLSDMGHFIQAENILNILATHLNTTAAIKRNPEILDEEVKVAATIVALHRTAAC
jgi:hypothetical protein